MTLMSPNDQALARRNGKTALLVALAVFLTDQASKWVILLAVLQPPRVIEVTPFFNLVLVYNTGVSFGLLGGDSALKPFLLAGFAVAVCIGLLIWMRRQPQEVPVLPAGLIIGGALGNALDRLLHPGVVDFLDFHLAGAHWPAFNIADSAISIAVGIWLWLSLSQSLQRGK